MLADTPPRTLGVGTLGKGIQQPGTFVMQLVHFVADHLPSWRDHPDRPAVCSETELTAQLGVYLNSEARRSMDFVQFMTEVPDSVQPGRHVDLAVQPCGVLHVEGQSFTQFQILLTIECKRLPTPRDSRRSEREYVTANVGSTTGGIQRFKLGAHASAHNLAVMIGYLQSGTATQWLQRINKWITEESKANVLWTGERLVAAVGSSRGHARSVHRFYSSHRRVKGTSDQIELWHLWIAIGIASRNKKCATSRRK